MISDTSLDLNAKPCSQDRQLSLFALDPWGAEHAVAVLERPTHGIARAMIGPLAPGDMTEPGNDQLRCLAATEDGAFAACTWISQAQLKDPKALWNQVIHDLAIARQNPISSLNLGSRVTPEDCLKAWADPELWVPKPRDGDPIHSSVRAVARLLAIHELGAAPCLSHEDRLRIEVQAQAMVWNQIESGVLLVLHALHPELREAVTIRPRMSVSMAHQLVSMARSHSPSAVPYALQALRTESLGVLHLITSGYPENDARRVREAIFSGHSLPDTFEQIGVTKSTHRRSVSKHVRCKELVPAPEMNLSDLPISCRDWLTVMRLTSKRAINPS